MDARAFYLQTHLHSFTYDMDFKRHCTSTYVAEHWASNGECDYSSSISNNVRGIGVDVGVIVAVCTSYNIQPSTSSFVWQQILVALISITWWMCLWRIRMSCLLDLHLRMCVWEGMLTIWVERPFLRISTIHCRSVSWSRWLLYKSWLSLFAIVYQVWICMHMYSYIERERWRLTNRWMDRF